ncbi:hypothetical protein BZG35_10650 [Brevundimonas sp. LM2]|nr:hypothetical protein BZG35_10650 [Brevundimonas sp. LM2]
MGRTPFDLSFEDLVEAGVKAARAAADEAKRADVPLAAFEAEPVTPPPWDEARRDLLKKLWLDGLSATQIAMRLGGVTRNKVIGEVRRLGLSSERPSGRHALARVRADGTATVLTLGAHMCKWPIGDPSSAEFTFCGRRAAEGVYCVEHARVAYSPATSGRKSEASLIPESKPRGVGTVTPLFAAEAVQIEVRRRLGL